MLSDKDLKTCLASLLSDDILEGPISLPLAALWLADLRTFKIALNLTQGDFAIISDRRFTRL
jgi:hypothetical protein